MFKYKIYINRNKKNKGFSKIRALCPSSFYVEEIMAAPKCQSILYSNSCLLYAMELAWKHCSTAANDKVIRVHPHKGSEISCIKPNRQICAFLWRICQPHELGSTYRLLHWNHDAKPVILHTINPNLKTTYCWP